MNEDNDYSGRNSHNDQNSSRNRNKNSSAISSPNRRSSRLGTYNTEEHYQGHIKEVYFHIDVHHDRTTFVESSPEDIFKFKNDSGFIRKAITNLRNIYDDNYPKGFVDPDFTVQKSKQYMLTRMSNLYDLEKSVPLFFSDDKEPRTIDKDACSFVCESGLLNPDYLRTIFITQSLNPAGRYVYFVKRDGEYVIEECDDVIPVDRKTWKPLWGLSYKNPWQLILLKAWMKECGGWQQMMNAQPFDFLKAFGAPSSRVFNFKKQLEFLNSERIPKEKRAQNIKYFSLNNQRAEIIGATHNDRNLYRVGLIPNRAGYIIQPIQVQQRQDNDRRQRLYRIRTSLPCSWIGKYTAVSETRLNQKFRDNDVNLESSFIMNETEVLQYFNMAHAYPRELTMIDHYRSQNCYTFHSDGIQPIWLSFTVPHLGDEEDQEEEGFCGFSIKMNARPSKYNKYPDLRYILAKQNNLEEAKRAHSREDIFGSDLKGNTYGNSSCDKWEYRRIDFLQGYHDTVTFYEHMTPGNYILLVKTEEDLQIRLRVDSHMPVEKVQHLELSENIRRQFYDSCFFGISRDAGVETSFNKKQFTESITLNNGFQEFGYGSIAIKTLERAKHKIGMRIFPEKLKRYGIKIIKEYESMIEQQDRDLPKYISMVSQKGIPRVIVMEREKDLRESTIGTIFPPKETVQFLMITPLKSKSSRKASSNKSKDKNS